MSERDDLVEQAHHSPVITTTHRTRQVFGIDTSLSNTGIAEFHEDSELPWLTFATTPPAIPDDVEHNADRIRTAATLIYQKVAGQAIPRADVWIIFEGPAIGAINGKPDERAGLRWYLTIAFRTAGYRVMFMPPATVKKYWTNNGNAPKPLMLGWAKRRYPDTFIRDHNVADALALAHAGARYRGLLPTPVPPEVNMTALAAIVWPKPQEA